MYKQLFKDSIDSIIISNVDGNIIDINPAATKMLGYSHKDLIGKPTKTLYALDKEFKNVSSNIKSTGEFKGEIINKTKSGSLINIFLAANWIRNEAGDVIGIMGISRDITPETTLRSEYSEFRNTISDIIYSTTPNGIFTYINKPVMNILGYTPEELVGKLFSDIIYKPHIKSVNQHYSSVVEKKQTQSYLEFQVIKKDGSLLWIGQKVSTKFNPVDKNKVEGFYGIVRDIDKQKKTEILLSESEENYRDSFDNSSDLIHRIDLLGNFTYTNNSWKKTMGYSEKEIKHLNLFSLIHPNSQQHCSLIFNDIIKTGVCPKNRIIYDLVAKNGKKITVEGTINLKSIDNTQSIQSFLRDVTQQKKSEKTLAKQAKTLRQITETLADVFYLYNRVEQKYEYISPNCELILGADDKFFYSGKSHSNTFADSETIKKLKEANKIIDSGTPYDIDFPITIAGETKWINEKSFPIKNEKGTTIANSGVCRDVTELKKANATIYKQNIEIGQSILYAKRLQESVLPSTKTLETLFPNSFVLYKPKDVVSGDFYIVDSIVENEHESMTSFIVGDCTGHGIPGAVLSLMCNVLVRESFVQKKINSPAEALDFTRNRLVKFFSLHEEKVIRDGMDVAYCVLNKKTNQIYFSGANNPCIIIRNGNVIEYKGEKQHIGFDETYKPFTNQVIDVQKNDSVYLFSDGYMDQFGGEKIKKLTRKRFYQILAEISHLPMPEIGDILNTKFLEWKKDFEQIDDVTVLGIKIE